MEHIIIEAENIRIGPIRIEDEQYLFDLYEYPLTPEQCHIVAGKFIHAKDELIHGIYENNELVGIVELYHHNGNIAEVGYRIRVSKRNRGLMKHALRLFVEQQMQFREIYARVNRRNRASVEVLKYAGFQRDRQQEHELVYIWQKQERKI